MLLFAMPQNWGTDQEDDDARLRLSRELVPCMIRVCIALYLDGLPPWNWGICWYVFLRISIEFVPVLLGKRPVIDIKGPIQVGRWSSSSGRRRFGRRRLSGQPWEARCGTLAWIPRWWCPSGPARQSISARRSATNNSWPQGGGPTPGIHLVLAGSWSPSAISFCFVLHASIAFLDVGLCIFDSFLNVLAGAIAPTCDAIGKLGFAHF
jgi:hypothetical protein